MTDYFSPGGMGWGIVVGAIIPCVVFELGYGWLGWFVALLIGVIVTFCAAAYEVICEETER